MSVPLIATEADFDDLSWHDARIWGIELRIADEFRRPLAELALHLEVITGFAPPVGGVSEVMTTPATLVFHAVTDPRIDLEWDDTGYVVAVHEVGIGSILRAEQRRTEQVVAPGRPYYLWRIATNWPEGEITFGASGFTQTLHVDPEGGRHVPFAGQARFATSQPTDSLPERTARSLIVPGQPV